MLFENMTDLEKNQYKRLGKLKEEYDLLNKECPLSGVLLRTENRKLL